MNEMIQNNNPPELYNLRHIIDELDDNGGDFADELQMLAVKEKVISVIRSNRECEAKIEEADRRIGSLVRNYKMLTNKALLHHLKEEAFSTEHRQPKDHGINDFSLEGKRRLRGYEHLVYLLQTQPKYMSFMIVHDLGSSLSFHKHLLSEMFEFLTTPRDAYLMLMIFKAALKEEIKSTISDPDEFVRGSPRIISMAVDIYRSLFRGSLFSTIQPLVVEMVYAKHANLNVDPISIYKQLMIENNKNMPHNFNAKEALSNPEVRDRLHAAVNNLIKVCDRFIDIFCSEEFIEEIPYGIRYLARCLWEMLKEKFPQIEQRKLLRIIAHFVYNKLIGACVQAPDGYGIIRLKPGERMSKDARHNLCSISKLLADAATGQRSFIAYQDVTDMYQSLALTQFLSDGHQRFKEFFRQVMIVESPEDSYEVNQFTDEALISPPTVTFKYSDLILLHHRVYEQRNILCPSTSDALNEVLDSLGPAPEAAVRSAESASKDKVDCQGFVKLNLKNPKAAFITAQEVQCLKAIKVKQAIIELIKQRPKSTDLHEVFFSPIRVEEAQSFIHRKQQLARSVSNEVKKQSVLFSTHGETLQTLLDFVLLNLKVINATNFDEISRQILADLKQKIENRELLKSELERLKSTLEMVEEKRQYNAKVLEYYKNYLKKCLDNMRCVSLNRIEKSSGKTVCLKYTALKLSAKGILIDLEGLEKKKWKEAVFEIRPLPNEVGLFQIRLLFKGGMEVASVKLELQYLLELHFKNQKEMNLTDKARINVILLLYLLDKKFYKAWD